MDLDGLMEMDLNGPMEMNLDGLVEMDSNRLIDGDRLGWTGGNGLGWTGSDGLECHLRYRHFGGSHKGMEYFNPIERRFSQIFFDFSEIISPWGHHIRKYPDRSISQKYREGRKKSRLVHTDIGT